MKKLLFIIGLLTLTNCSSDDNTTLPAQDIVEEEIIVRQGDVVDFYLSPYYEGFTRITDQAEHFVISEIVFQNGIYYNYKSVDGYVGQDYVEITETITAATNIETKKKIYKLSITVLPIK